MPKYYKYKLALTTAVCLASSMPMVAHTQEGGQRQGAQAGAYIEEILITARRREESLQEVPVSVNAFSDIRLQEASVTKLSDLTALSPGLRFQAEGGQTNTSVSMRGLSKLPIGEGIPAVVLYFNEAPMPGEGINLPIYDLANIQVLKGPQGTLFGRNTLGGAILMTSKPPGYEQDAYLQTTVGDYNLWEVQGAGNLTLIEDKLALRVAAQARDQDGFTKNLSGGRDFDDVNERSVRLSLLFDPLENLSNLLVADYFESHQQPGGQVIHDYHPSAFGPQAAIFDAALRPYVEGQRRAGPHKVYSDLDNPHADRRSWGAVNKTTWDIADNITVQNIFSYREAFVSTQINTGGNGPLNVELAPGFFSDFVLFRASSVMRREFLTNEIQLQGSSLGDRLEWIAGYFYNNDKANGPMGSQFQIFDPLFDGPDLSYSASYVENENEAIFAQIGYDLTDTLTFNLGVRYSWDKVTGCGGSRPDRYISLGECKSIAALDLPDGTGISKVKGEEPTYTVGLDWQATDDLFFYITHRYGYRGVGLNSPSFETQFTTGGEGCELAGVAVTCPDLRPFQTTGKETVEDFEIGMKSDWYFNDVAARLNVSVFQMKYEDGLQFFNAVSLAGVPSNAPDVPNRSSIGVNVADFTIRGVEFDGSISPIPALTIGFNGAYIDQKVDKLGASPFGSIGKDEVTLPTPEFSGTLSLRWELPIQPVGGQLIWNTDYFYTEKWDGQVGVALPGYDVVNTRLDWRGINGGGLDLGFWITNVLDEDYATAPTTLSPTFPTATVFYGPPRMFGFDLRYSWGS